MALRRSKSSSLRIASERRAAWRDFMDFVDRHQQSTWIFRGVADAAAHALVPKVGRDKKLYDRDAEPVIFANFKRRARQYVDMRDMSEWDILALLHIDEYEEEDAEPEPEGAVADADVDDPLPRSASAQATAGWINDVDS
jgi:hypothetical protein